jgi:hypothetical protein
VRSALLRYAAGRTWHLVAVGSVVFNAAVLGGLLVLYPFVFRWAYRLEPDRFDKRQVARQRNCRVYVFIVPGLAIVEVLRLILEISDLH